MALMAALASAAPANDDICTDFRVTSPHTYFKTTAGQCYQVSYDFGGSTPGKTSSITVDLYEYKTNKLIANQIKNAPASGIATPWFNVDLGNYKKTGDYYFLITFDKNCKPVKSTYFNVIYNKNSPPAQCPN
jgi:hypothetical protein